MLWGHYSTQHKDVLRASSAWASIFTELTILGREID